MPKDYTKNVTLKCPACGHTDMDKSPSHLKCGHCGAQMTERDLIKGNDDHIKREAELLAREAAEDLLKDFAKKLRRRL